MEGEREEDNPDLTQIGLLITNEEEEEERVDQSPGVRPSELRGHEGLPIATSSPTSSRRHVEHVRTSTSGRHTTPGSPPRPPFHPSHVETSRLSHVETNVSALTQNQRRFEELLLSQSQRLDEILYTINNDTPRGSPRRRVTFSTEPPRGGESVGGEPSEDRGGLERVGGGGADGGGEAFGLLIPNPVVRERTSGRSRRSADPSANEAAASNPSSSNNASSTNRSSTPGAAAASGDGEAEKSSGRGGVVAAGGAGDGGGGGPPHRDTNGRSDPHNRRASTPGGPPPHPHARGGGSPRPSPIKPLWPTYDEEKTNIKTFGRLFVEQARQTEYPEALWISTYSNLLRGLAQNLASMFRDQQPECDFAELRRFVEAALSRDQDHTARLAFRTHRRAKGQSVVSYGAQLRTMAYRAYGNSDEPWTPGQIDERVLEVFLANLGGDLGKMLRTRFPTSLTEAIDLSRNLEIEGYTEESTSTVAAATGGFRGNNNSNHGNNNNNNRRNNNGPQRSQRNSSSSSSNNNNSNNNNNNAVENRICHFCHLRGHLRQNCRKYKAYLKDKEGEKKDDSNGKKGKKGDDRDASSSD